MKWLISHNISEVQYHRKCSALCKDDRILEKETVTVVSHTYRTPDKWHSDTKIINLFVHKWYIPFHHSKFIPLCSECLPSAHYWRKLLKTTRGTTKPNPDEDIPAKRSTDVARLHRRTFSHRKFVRIEQKFELNGLFTLTIWRFSVIHDFEVKDFQPNGYHSTKFK